MTVEEKAYNYASKLVKNRLTASEVAAHYGRGYIEGQEDMKHLGWRPANEAPKVGKDGDAEVIVIQDNNDVSKAIYCEIEGIGMWDLPNIKWWCYPPEEE